MSKITYQKILFVFIFTFLITNIFAKTIEVYEVEFSHNNELFIIDDEKFEEKRYCDVEAEDEVIFIEGGPDEACVSAIFINLRTKEECEVWCD
jgi:hypothetical protein